MNNLYIIIRLTFCVFICNQNMLSMERVEPLNFSCLASEIQDKIFFYNSRTTLQLINKSWSIDASIASPRAFDNNLAGLSRDHMIRVVIHAAYVGNYKGVENILKNSSLLGCTKKDKESCDKDHILYYYMEHGDEKKVIDFYDVVDNQEKEWSRLLTHYRIVKAPRSWQRLKIDFLTMSCLAGNSSIINTIAHDEKINLENAFDISINCEHYSCVKKIIDNLYCDTSIGDFSANTKNTRLLLTINSLHRACLTRNIKIIKEILNTEEIDINTIQTTAAAAQITLLDQMVALAQNNSEYNDVVLLLQEYGAKTMQEVRERSEEEKEIILNALSCVIS
jgi:hypothetical protein